MKALVTGAEGQVGSELPGALARSGFDDVMVATRAAIDLSDAAATRAGVKEAAPDVVVNCAAYNAVDQAEAEPEVAMAINGVAPGVLAEACRDRGAHLIHISTDYVFSGDKGEPYDEDDAPAPVSAYGRSKLAGEEAVAAVGGSTTLVRAALVFGRVGRSLVELIATKARAGEPLTMVDDQRGSPTHAADLAGTLAEMARRRIEGLFHVTNAGDCSPYELAQLVVGVLGLEGASVERTTAAAFGRPAARPANSALVSTRLEPAGLEPLRPYEEAVRERVSELVAARSVS